MLITLVSNLNKNTGSNLAISLDSSRVCTINLLIKNYDLIDTYIVLDKYIDRRDFELYDFEPIRTDKNRRFRAKNGETMSTCSLKSWV